MCPYCNIWHEHEYMLEHLVGIHSYSTDSTIETVLARLRPLGGVMTKEVDNDKLPDYIHKGHLA